MKVTIGLTHSADYVRSLRLDEGDNVPAVTDFAVLISDLSTEARSVPLCSIVETVATQATSLGCVMIAVGAL